MDDERIWLEAATAVEAELQAEVVDEAYEVYVAEAARTRVVDHEGAVRLRLRSGALVDGDVVADEPIAEHLRVHLSIAEDAVVPVAGLVAMCGSGPRLRREGVPDESRSLSALLRSCWLAGVPVRVGTCDGVMWSGTITRVGGDHIELLDHLGEGWVLPFVSVECWIVPRDVD
jgi:hypothetical protein